MDALVLSHTKCIRIAGGKGQPLTLKQKQNTNKTSEVVEMTSRIVKRLGFGVILSRFKSQFCHLLTVKL